MWETQVRPLGREDPLEKEMATHSSTLAWRIPWREEPGRLQSMGSQRVGHGWATSLSLYTPYINDRDDAERKMVEKGTDTEIWWPPHECLTSHEVSPASMSLYPKHSLKEGSDLSCEDLLSLLLPKADYYGNYGKLSWTELSFLGFADCVLGEISDFMSSLFSPFPIVFLLIFSFKASMLLNSMARCTWGSHSRHSNIHWPPDPNSTHRTPGVDSQCLPHIDQCRGP